MDYEKLRLMISTTGGAIGALIAPWLGGWDKMLVVLLSMMAMDYVTGLIVAGIFKSSPKSENGGLESRAGLKGIFRKLAMLGGVFLAVQLDVVVGVQMARGFTIVFFVANEGLSIVENFGLMGVPLPGFLGTALEALKAKGNEGGAKDATNQKM